LSSSNPFEPVAKAAGEEGDAVEAVAIEEEAQENASKGPGEIK